MRNNTKSFNSKLVFLLLGVWAFFSTLSASNTLALNEAENMILQKGEIVQRDAIHVESGGTIIEALGKFHAPLNDIIHIITTYEEYSEYMPNVVQVDVIHQDSLGATLNFYLELPLGIEKKYRILISETTLSDSATLIAWESLGWPGLLPSETIKETTGHWLIQETSDSTSIVLYNVFTDLGPIPWGLGWIVDLLSKGSIPDVLEQTKLQAEAYSRSHKQDVKTVSERVLFVVTSNDQLGTTGEKTGYYFSEVTHPYFQIVEAGFEVDIASPKGGLAPMDPRSLKLKDRLNRRFYENPAHMSKLEKTLLLENIVSSDYSAILFVGGHGGMWDFPQNEFIGKLTANIYENGGITAAVCHGPAALVDIKLSDDSYLIAGKALTSFTNAEEDVKNLTKEMPFLLESKLIERGALFTKAGVWQEKVVVSDRLITGQNPASAEAVGKAIVELLKSQHE